ncbi:MAG: hypothetical protein NW226_05310 [Microscillaceae bacterium]|nr:hypothetical protein [Microscillaceae bacterium]
MIRKIIIPTQDSYLLQLPAYFIGKKVEVLAFELKSETIRKSKTTVPESKEDRILYLKKVLDKFRVDLSNFTFNRDEANEYD